MAVEIALTATPDLLNSIEEGNLNSDDKSNDDSFDSKPSLHNYVPAHE